MPRQTKKEQVLALVEQDKSPAEIARKLNTTPQAVYQQVARLRSEGRIPKAGAGRKKARAARRARATATVAVAPPEPTIEERAVAAANGHADLTVEDHIRIEHETVQQRLEAIASERAALEGEESTLTQRGEQLAAASKAFATFAG